MSILATIKAASLQARKNKETKKAALLSTLISEASMVGKNNGNRESTDGEVIAIVKKMVANANEIIDTLNRMPHVESNVGDLLEEVAVLSAFLPKQLSTQELTNCITNLINCYNATSIKDMGKIMKKLKEDFEGHYDGTEASKIIKEKLSGN